MNVLVELLLWPVAVFLQAVVGILCRTKSPQTAMYQHIARGALLACCVAFLTIPLSLLAAPAIGLKPPLVLGVVLLVVFIVFGNLSAVDAEDDDDLSDRNG